MKKAIVLLLIKVSIILSLVSCSQSSTPSSSNVEEQLENIFQECKNISIADVEKINGIPKDGLAHVVKVKFTVLSTPPSANKDIWEAYKARKEAANEAYQKMQEQDLALISEVIDVENKLRNLPGNAYTDKRDEEYFQTEKELDRAKQKHKEFSQNKKNIKIDTEYRSVLSEEFQNRQKLVGNFKKECPYPRQRLVKDIVGDIFGKDENLGEEIELEYTAEITMLKTDNGWMIEL